MALGVFQAVCGGQHFLLKAARAVRSGPTRHHILEAGEGDRCSLMQFHHHITLPWVPSGPRMLLSLSSAIFQYKQVKQS